MVVCAMLDNGKHRNGGVTFAFAFIYFIYLFFQVLYICLHAIPTYITGSGGNVKLVKEAQQCNWHLLCHVPTQLKIKVPIRTKNA